MSRELVLFQSYWPVPPASTEFGYYPNDYAQQVEEAARASIAAVAQPGERSLVASGGAAEAIVATAEELDACLVVMASSGKGLARRLTLGSTTDAVLHHLRRPLLIIPRASNEG